MLQPESIIRVADNSGALDVRCIRPLNNTRFSFMLKFLIISVIKLRFQRKIVRKKMYLALQLRQNVNFFRKSGLKLKFFNNNVILMSDKTRINAKKVKGSTVKEFSKLKIENFSSLIPEKNIV